MSQAQWIHVDKVLRKSHHGMAIATAMSRKRRRDRGPCRPVYIDSDGKREDASAMVMTGM